MIEVVPPAQVLAVEELDPAGAAEDGGVGVAINWRLVIEQKSKSADDELRADESECEGFRTRQCAAPYAHHPFDTQATGMATPRKATPLSRKNKGATWGQRASRI